jgi:hypothetical protein
MPRRRLWRQQRRLAAAAVWMSLGGTWACSVGRSCSGAPAGGQRWWLATCSKLQHCSKVGVEEARWADLGVQVFQGMREGGCGGRHVVMLVHLVNATAFVIWLSGYYRPQRSRSRTPLGALSHSPL